MVAGGEPVVEEPAVEEPVVEEPAVAEGPADVEGLIVVEERIVVAVAVAAAAEALQQPLPAGAKSYYR